MTLQPTLEAQMDDVLASTEQRLQDERQSLKAEIVSLEAQARTATERKLEIDRLLGRIMTQREMLARVKFYPIFTCTERGPHASHTHAVDGIVVWCEGNPE